MNTVTFTGIDPEAVREDTWGHLRTQSNAWHPGVIVFAESAYGGERVILHADFGDGVPDSPWFYEHVHEWLWGQDAEPGALYTFTGWYRVGRSGAYEFHGAIASAALAEGPKAACDAPTAAGRALLAGLETETEGR